MSQKPTPCPQCHKPGTSDCSRAKCARRRPVTAQPIGGQIGPGLFRANPGKSGGS